MPARTASTAVAKRKSPEGQSPANGSKAKKNRHPPAAASNLFLRGLAAQLASEADEADGQVDIDIRGALQAALGALPEGKLKGALLKNEHEALETLVAEFESVLQQQQQQEDKKEADKSDSSGSGDAAAALGDAAASTGGASEVVVPCTVQLYRRARAIAENTGSSNNATERNLLKALALNPRAPLDLLVDAVATTDGGNNTASSDPSTTTTLEAAVGGLRSLTKALGADPRAALSPAGLAFFADRAAVLASSAAKAMTAASKRSDDRDQAGAATGEEALGLMLRVLQVAGMGLSARGVAEDGGADGAGDGNTQGAAEPSQRLLLPCSPETSSASAQVRTVPTSVRVCEFAHGCAKCFFQ